MLAPGMGSAGLQALVAVAPSAADFTRHARFSSTFTVKKILDRKTPSIDDVYGFDSVGTPLAHPLRAPAADPVNN
jgi:hypothetical protein